MTTTNANQSPGRRHTQGTRARIQNKALKQGAQRSEAVHTAIRLSMKMITDEIKANDGIYPNNKGRLSLNEVFRRAGINGTTLFGAKHKHLHSEVTNWLKNFKAQSVTDHPRVRREITSRVADWQQRYQGLSDSHRKTELDLQESERKLRDAEDQIEALTKQNVVLTQALNKATGSKIVNLHNKV